MGWQQNFVGRETDLKVLQDAWAHAKNGAPRVVALVAESGFGKTRLAQEFYNWLSVMEDKSGAAGYWPDGLLQNDDNLSVNPDICQCGLSNARMPFLWWGLRVADPGRRNSTAGVSALTAGLGNLQAHLGIYDKQQGIDGVNRQRLIGGGKATVDMALGVGETALEAFASVATFGVLGLGKAAVDAGREQIALRKEVRELESLDAAPGAVEQRERDKLTETVANDLYRIAKDPPANISAVPIVLLVDDAHWLSKDESTRSFLDKLMTRARKESWPLLLLVTSWRREWVSSVNAGEMPGTLVCEGQGDVTHELDGIASLGRVIEEAFPGLLSEQVKIIEKKSEGSPRILDEVLMHLRRNRKFFVKRDQTAALTEAGVKALSEGKFSDFLAERLAEAPEHVRCALAIASKHGIRFSERLVRDLADRMQLPDAEIGLREAENPNSFIVNNVSAHASEFRMRTYQLAAADDLENWIDEDEIDEHLDQVLTEIISKPTTATDEELAFALDIAEQDQAASEKWRNLGIQAAAEMIQRAERSLDTLTAGAIADRAFTLTADRLEADLIYPLSVILDAITKASSPRRSVSERWSEIVDFLRDQVSKDPTPEGLQDLARGLGRLGRVLSQLDGPSAARALHEEEVSINRHRVAGKPTPVAWGDLATSLGRLGEILLQLEGPAAAFELIKEEVGVFRQLVAVDPTPDARCALAIGLESLGEILWQLGNPAAALDLHEEAVEILRHVSKENPKPDFRRSLAIGLGSLGETVRQLEGPAAAFELHWEAVEILRHLQKEHPTLTVLRELAVGLGKLGQIHSLLERPEAARDLHEEEVKILRRVAENTQTPGVWRDLSIGLNGLAGTLSQLGELRAARELHEEEEKINRRLAKQHPTPGARRDLALCLGALGGIILQLEGPAAARALHEEEVDILLHLVRDDPTPDVCRELAVGLSELGEIASQLEYHKDAVKLHEEAVKIFRHLAEEHETNDTRHELQTSFERLRSAHKLQAESGTDTKS